MDPDAALAQIRELVVKHQTDNELSDSDAAELVELIDGLDEWLTKGGFSPEDWERPAR